MGNVQLIIDNYQEGKEIHWSAFSSGSVDRSDASGFACKSGLLFKLQVRACARDIQKVSAMPSEQERLILPNTKFVVTKGAHHAQDGMREVHMIEVKGQFVLERKECAPAVAISPKGGITAALAAVVASGGRI